MSSKRVRAWAPTYGPPTYAQWKKTATKGQKKYVSKRFANMRAARNNAMGRQWGPTKSIVDMGVGFPKKCKATLKYYEVVQMTSTTGVVAKYQWSCNGLYDPNITAGGHQPMYFDSYMALYDHYTVIGSKLTIKMVQNATNINPTTVAVYQDDDTTTTNVAAPETAAEQAGAQIMLFAAGDNNPRSITSTWSAKKTFGGSILGNDNLQGNASGNPSEQTYYTVTLKACDGASTVSFQACLHFEYIVIFDELKEQAQN